MICQQTMGYDLCFCLCCCYMSVSDISSSKCTQNVLTSIDCDINEPYLSYNVCKH